MTQTFLSKRLLHLVAPLAAVVLLFSGCGDDDETSAGANGGGPVSVETNSLTKAQYIERADEICLEEEKGLEKLAAGFFRSPPSTTNPSEQASALVNQVLIPGYEELIERLASLGAPAGDEKEVSAFLTALQRSVEAGAKDPLKFVQSQEPFPEGVKLSNAYGYEVCLA
jgi:hypothetical protein